MRSLWGDARFPPSSQQAWESDRSSKPGHNDALSWGNIKPQGLGLAVGCAVRASASQGKVNSSLDSVSGQLAGGIREEESQSGHICLEAFTLQGHAQLDVCDKLESLYKGPSNLSQLDKVDQEKS